MGNKESSTQSGEGQDWSQFQRNPQYVNTLQQAYVQQGEARYDGGQTSYGFGQERTRDIKTENQKMSAVKVDFDIDTKSLKLEMDTMIPNQFSLLFTTKADVQIDVMIYFASKINYDRETKSITTIHPRRPEDCRKFSFDSGVNSLKPGMCTINFSNYTFKELSRAFDDVIPIVVILDRKTKLPGFLEKVVYFLQIDQKTLTPSVINKNIVLNGQWNNLVDVYGIGKSILKPTTDNDEACLICFTEGTIDTIIQPCNHMCLCHDCAAIMKNKTEKCPICRQPMETFLTLKRQ